MSDIFFVLNTICILQILQQKFEDFIRELNSGEERITAINNTATTMCNAKHFETNNIEKRRSEINQMWSELKEVAHARQEVSFQLFPSILILKPDNLSHLYYFATYLSPWILMRSYIHCQLIYKKKLWNLTKAT